MVKIVSENVQPMAGGNFLGYTGRTQGDMSGAAAFEGATKSIQQLTAAFNMYVQEDIDKTVRSAADELNAQLGVDTYGKKQDQKEGGPQNILPPKVQADIGNSYDGLRKAYEQGKMSHSEYLARLRATQKSLYAKYPGMKDEIDAAFQKATGIEPGRAIRQQIFKEQANMQKAELDSRRKYMSLVKDAAKMGAILPNEVEAFMKEADDPLKRANNQVVILQRISKISQIEAEKKYLDLKKKRGDLQAQEAERFVAKTLADYDRIFLEALTKSVTGDYDVNKLGEVISQPFMKDVKSRTAKFYEMREKALADGVIDPGEMQQLQTIVFQIRESYKQGITALLYKPDENGVSLASLLPPDKLTKIVEDKVKQFDVMFVQPLVGESGNLTLLKLNTNIVKHVENYEALKHLEKNDVLRRFMGLKKIVGEKAFTFLITQMFATGKGEEVIRLFQDPRFNEGDKIYVLNKTAELMETGKPISEAFKESELTYTKELKDKRGAINRATVDSLVTVLTSKDTSLEGKEKAARVLFGDPDFLTKISPEQREKVFRWLVNPETVKAVSPILKKDPEFAKKYNMFIARSAAILLKEKAANLKRTAAMNEGKVKITFENGKFKVERTGESFVTAPFMGGVPAENMAAEVDAEALNQFLDTVKNALDLSGANGAAFIENMVKVELPEFVVEKQKEGGATTPQEKTPTSDAEQVEPNVSPEQQQYLEDTFSSPPQKEGDAKEIEKKLKEGAFQVDPASGTTDWLNQYDPDINPEDVNYAPGEIVGKDYRPDLQVEPVEVKELPPIESGAEGGNDMSVKDSIVSGIKKRIDEALEKVKKGEDKKKAVEEIKKEAEKAFEEAVNKAKETGQLEVGEDGVKIYPVNRPITTVKEDAPYVQESYKGLQYLEGFVPTAYKDIGGVWTIGYGFTGKWVKPGVRISKKKALKLLHKKIRYFEKEIRGAIKPEIWKKLKPHQIAALLSFVYNVGMKHFRESTMLKKLNRGDFEGAANEFKRWIYVNGRIVKGQIRRRKIEEEVFRGKRKF